jgi:hypothetical protein
MPGRTTDTAHQNLLAHAGANNRIALARPRRHRDRRDADRVRGGGPQPTASRRRVRAVGGRRPASPAARRRTVPYSAVAAGMMARNDSPGISPNVPAANNLGEAQYAIGLSQPAGTRRPGDAQRRRRERRPDDVRRRPHVRLPDAREPDRQPARPRALERPARDGDHGRPERRRRAVRVRAGRRPQHHRRRLRRRHRRRAAALVRRRLALRGDARRGVQRRRRRAGQPAVAARRGQLSAQVNVRISPFAEQIQIFITKRSITEEVL